MNNNQDIYRMEDSFYHSWLKNDYCEYKDNNSLFRVEPPKVVLQLQPTIQARQTIRIINITEKNQRCFVLPLESDYFKIKYQNQEFIAAGLSMPIEVFLVAPPSEALKNERAWLKIHCFDADNLVIPIEVAETDTDADIQISKIIDFGLVPLCEIISQKIMISHISKENDVINVTILEPHVDIAVNIKKGNPNEPSFVEVTYCPTSYTTMTMSMMILSPAFKSYYPVVQVMGHCRPLALKEEYQKINNQKVLFLKQCEKEISKRNKICQKYEQKESEQKAMKHPQKKDQSSEAQIGGPDRLWWLQKDFVKPQLFEELLGPLGRTDEEDAEIKKSKDEIFHNAVQKIKQRMKLVLIRTDVENVGMGNEIPDLNYDMDWHTYMGLRSLPMDDSIFKSDELTAIKQRVVKQPEQCPDSKFKKHVPCYSWFTRFRPLCKFIQAARQVIIRNRLAKRLQMLQQYIIEMQSPSLEEEEEEEIETEEQATIKFFGSGFKFVPK